MPLTNSLEAVFSIWDDQSGSRIEIGDDLDGLDMMSIRFVADDGAKGPSLDFTQEKIPLLLEAIERWQKFAAERKAK